MEPGVYCGCGFRYVPASLRTWNFSKLYQTQGHHQLFSKQYLLAAASCSLFQSSPFHNYIISLKTDQSLLNLDSSNSNSRQTTHTYVNFMAFCLHNPFPFPFYNLAEHNLSIFLDLWFLQSSQTQIKTLSASIDHLELWVNSKI